MTYDPTTPDSTAPAGDPPSALELTRRVRAEALLGVIAIAIVVLTALPDLGPVAAVPSTTEESVSVPMPVVTTPAHTVRPVQHPGGVERT